MARYLLFLACFLGLVLGGLLRLAGKMEANQQAQEEALRPIACLTPEGRLSWASESEVAGFVARGYVCVRPEGAAED